MTTDLAKQLARAEAAASAPGGSVTCAGSRHALIFAREQTSGMAASFACGLSREDRLHLAESIAATVAALWEARREIQQLKEGKG